jgi:subtilase family serine protease
MRRKYVRNLIFLGTVLLLIGVSVVVLGKNAQPDFGTPVSLGEHVNPLIHKAQSVHPTPGTQPLAISVGLQMRNQTEFTSMVHAIYDPHSPQYHKYLTPDQFVQNFAPTSDQVQEVTNYLQKQGMAVTKIAPNNLLLDVSANVAEAQHAFDVQINTYKVGKSTFYANASPLKVPGKIGSLLTAVVGLDSSIKFHTSSPHTTLTPTNGPVGYQPKDIASAYDLAPLQSAGFLGENQTIALFELDGYLPSDVTQYIQYFNPASAATTFGSGSPVTATSTPAATDTATPVPTTTASSNTGGTPGTSATPTDTPG